MCRTNGMMRFQSYREAYERAHGEGYGEAYRELYKEGVAMGSTMQLIKQVCAKMQKFSSAEEIADDLVIQYVPLIRKIMDVAPDFAPDYNVNDIYDALNV